MLWSLALASTCSKYHTYGSPEFVKTQRVGQVARISSIEPGSAQDTTEQPQKMPRWAVGITGLLFCKSNPANIGTQRYDRSAQILGVKFQCSKMGPNAEYQSKRNQPNLSPDVQQPRFRLLSAYHSPLRKNKECMPPVHLRRLLGVRGIGRLPSSGKLRGTLPRLTKYASQRRLIVDGPSLGRSQGQKSE